MGKFRELKVWQRGKDLAITIYRMTSHGTFYRDYGLRDQIRRAAVSIPSNIAGSAPQGERPMFFVYAIRSLSTNRIYIGHTKDFENRLNYHNSGYVTSTSRGKPWTLIALQKVVSRDEARWIERNLKNSKGKRTKWIDQNRIERQAPPRRGGDELGTNKQAIRYFYTAKGSSAEVLTQAIIAAEIGYISADDFACIEKECQSISGMLMRLIKSRAKTLPR